MSAWGEMRKRSSGEILRKEDIVYFWSYGEKNPFKGVLDSGTEKILSEILSLQTTFSAKIHECLLQKLIKKN